MAYSMEVLIGVLREKVRTYLVTTGRSADALDEQLGRARGRINKLLRGEESVSRMEHVLRLCDLIGVHPAELMAEAFPQTREDDVISRIKRLVGGDQALVGQLDELVERKVEEKLREGKKKV